MWDDIKPNFSDNFLVLGSNLSVRQISDSIDALKPHYLVLYRHDDPSLKYVFLTDAIVEAIKKLHPNMDETIKEFLRLRESHSSLVLESYNQTKYILDKIDEPILVLKEGNIHGIFDDLTKKTYVLKGLDRSFTLPTNHPLFDNVSKPNLAGNSSTTEFVSKGMARVTRGLKRVTRGNSGSPPPDDFSIKTSIDDDDEKFVRYPYGKFPKNIEKGKITQLEIRVSETPRSGSPDEQSTKVDLTKKPGEDVALLAIVDYYPSGAFELGERTKEIKIPNNGEPTPIYFDLKAVSIGDAHIYVNFLHYGSIVGRLDFDCTVSTTLTQASIISTESSKFKVSKNPPETDLTLYIYDKSEELLEYRIAFMSNKIGLPIYEYDLKFKSNPEQKFQTTFERLEQILNDRNANSDILERNIEEIGMSLYDEIFHDERARNAFWDNREKITSIRVFSKEPWIPWELIKPHGDVDGKPEEDVFFCERIFSRWMTQTPPNPKQELRTITLVVPSNTGLSGAQNERLFIEEFARDNGLPQPKNVSKFSDVLTSLQAGGFDILHFCTHGRYKKENSQFSELDITDTSLTPVTITGRAKTFGVSHPLVILNACQLGQQGFSLTGIGGWAKAVLGAGASAFIGAMWEVADDTAFKFTQYLYTKLAEGTSLDEAVRFARINSRTKGDPTWLAYTLYSASSETVKFNGQTPQAAAN